MKQRVILTFSRKGFANESWNQAGGPLRVSMIWQRLQKPNSLGRRLQTAGEGSTGTYSKACQQYLTPYLLGEDRWYFAMKQVKILK